MPDFKVDIKLDLCKIRYNGCKIDPCNRIYLLIELFNKEKCTEKYSTEFPIRLYDTFRFTQHFYGCASYFSVIDKLCNVPITFELVEVDSMCGESSRSYFDSNARDLSGLCDRGPKFCEGRNITLCNKPSSRDLDEPVITVNVTSQLCKLPCMDESAICRSPCRPISKPRQCYDAYEPRNCCETYERYTPRRSCSPRVRRYRSMPLTRCSPSRTPSPTFCCKPICPEIDYTRPKSRCDTEDRNWHMEITRLTKNLREVNAQIRCLTSMHKMRSPMSPLTASNREVSFGSGYKHMVSSPREKFMASMTGRKTPAHRWTY